MSTLALPQTNGSKALPTLESWKRDSVKTFFTGINWEDYTSAVQASKRSLSESSNAPLNLKMSVSQFFAAINWKDIAIAAVNTAPPAPSSNNDDLTLDGFFGLF